MDAYVVLDRIGAGQVCEIASISARDLAAFYIMAPAKLVFASTDA